MIWVAGAVFGVFCGVASAGAQGAAPVEHAAKGIVLKVDAAHRTLEVSCEEIPNYMSAMEMEFTLRDPGAAGGLKPGSRIAFTVVDDGTTTYADKIKEEAGAVPEPEPMAAAGLSGLQRALHPGAAQPVAVGAPVPEFTLTDQAGARISLADLRGKVVVLTFGYSRCPNPNYCYRLSNNLAKVSRALPEHLGGDLVLLTIAIDPEHDQGQALADYAAGFHADSRSWHFLTGQLPEIERVAAMFGTNFWTNEGLLTHSLHTAVIDREGRLAANLEGNAFTPEQLTDLVRSVLARP